MKRVLGTILFVIYAIVAITVTVLLLSFNDFQCSELGGYTVFTTKNDQLEPQYKQGSILITRQISDRNLQIGDEILLYKVVNTQEFELKVATLQNKIQQGRHIMYTTDEGESYAAEYLIGRTSDTKAIEGWGYVLGILESKWGYLFGVVIVSLLLFLQEVFDLVMELKYGEGSKKKQAERAAKAMAQVQAMNNTNMAGAEVGAGVPNMGAGVGTRVGVGAGVSNTGARVATRTRTAATPRTTATAKTATARTTTAKTTTARTATAKSTTTKSTTAAKAASATKTKNVKKEE